MPVVYSQHGVIVKTAGIDVIGGRRYKTIQMPDSKLWLAENLDFKFCNIGGSGSPTTPNAWYYNNDETTYGWNGYKCGLLYNWYAVKWLEDHKTELCPGWHVPTKGEWDALATACGGASTAGSKLKAKDNSVTSNWPSGWNSTDGYGFEALPSGYYYGSFDLANTHAFFWNSVEYSYDNAYSDALGTAAELLSNNYSKSLGFSLRLVRDSQ